MPCVCTTETTNDTWFNQFVMLCDENAGPRQKQRKGKRPRSDRVEDYKENLESTVFQPNNNLFIFFFFNRNIVRLLNSEIRSP